MPFVKLDCAILESSLWSDRDVRDVFITALLLARPIEIDEPTPTIEIRTLDPGDYTVPPGRYGFVAASGVGLVARAGLERKPGLDALEVLANPDQESRSQDHDGRRLVRVDGGFVVLNFDRFRAKDHTAAKRQALYRSRKRDASKRDVTRNSEPEGRVDPHGVTPLRDSVTRNERDESENVTVSRRDDVVECKSPSRDVTPLQGVTSRKSEDRGHTNNPPTPPEVEPQQAPGLRPDPAGETFTLTAPPVTVEAGDESYVLAVLGMLRAACQELQGPRAGPRDNAHSRKLIRKARDDFGATLDDWRTVIRRQLENVRPRPETWHYLALETLVRPKNWHRRLTAPHGRAAPAWAPSNFDQSGPTPEELPDADPQPDPW